MSSPCDCLICQAWRRTLDAAKDEARREMAREIDGWLAEGEADCAKEVTETCGDRFIGGQGYGHSRVRAMLREKGWLDAE